MKRVLIEDWLPIQELGIESRRERGAASALPPISFLHVWWARRPLAASAGVVLAGLLPPWSDSLADHFPSTPELSNAISYKKWFMDLIGIWGDPIQGKKNVDAAKLAGVKLVGNGYGYKQSFRNTVSEKNKKLLNEVLEYHWGFHPIVCDPTAGGGSIPFSSAKLGITTIANELNGVAASILYSGVKTPVDIGLKIMPAIKKYGEILVSDISNILGEFFPKQNSEEIIAYIWANSVACPRTGKIIPLLPDFWLRKEKGLEVAVELVTKDSSGADLPEIDYVLKFGKDVIAKEADKGTIKRGDGISPFDNLIIDSEYIKSEAKEGRLKPLLYAIAIRKPDGTRTLRSPNQIDFNALNNAEDFLKKTRSEWERDGYLPTESFPTGNDNRPIVYGMNLWADMFTSRQLISHGAFAKSFNELIPVIKKEEPELADAILSELTMIQGKSLNWNSRLSSWNVNKQGMRSVFDRHDFSFKWTFGEFDASGALYQWSLSQLVDAYEGICKMLGDAGPESISDKLLAKPNVSIFQGSASNMKGIDSGSITHLCMDPPYFDNVMYAELADFFYVWEKRTLGRIHPEFYPADLSDKNDEAVANPSRFESAGKRKMELAELDYQSKMTAIFSECKRVLNDEGIMTVMFTHKKAEAWDSLGSGLLNSGFTIESSWPVNTEPENSLHQANMNSAASTIMLVCRKKVAMQNTSKTFLEDIANEVRSAARDSVQKFENDGISGVDLLLSTYGPTLSVISKYWPVYSSTPDELGKDRYLRPEEALNIAREELVALRQKRLVGHAAKLDSLTDFVVIAWDTFKAREFAFDTARLLALAVGGLDIDFLVRQKIVEKSAGKVRLLSPNERLRRDSDADLAGVRIEASSFHYMVDAIDTMLFIAQEDGMAVAKRFLDKTGLISNDIFRDAVQATVNAIPRTQIKNEWVVQEAGLLDTLVTAYFPEISLPSLLEIQAKQEIPTLFDSPEDSIVISE